MITTIIGEHRLSTAILLASVVGGMFILSSLRRPRGRGCTISGPKPWPLLGNIVGINMNAPWLSYMNLTKEFGKIFLTTAFGLDIVVISDEAIARELLDVRSSKYSGRLSYPTAKPYGFDFHTAYRDMQLRKAHQLVTNILESPDNHREHIQTFASSVILSAAYGYQARPIKDRLVEKMTHTLEVIIQAVSPEKALLVGLLPFVKYIPSWLPGGSFNAASCRKSIGELSHGPFLCLKETIESESSVPSLGYSGVSRQSQISVNAPWASDQQLAQDVCLSAFSGEEQFSHPFTFSTLFVFVLAMVLHPKVQERAYAEIMSVCGIGRIPTFDDRQALPYVDAVIRETLRWYPVVPMGIPHTATEDDIYGDDLIPKGTIIIVNVWALTHDEARFPRASEFIPERFLTDEGTLTDERVDFAFGFGRRVCPGNHFADASIWAAVASMITAFRFEKVKDEQGRDIDFEPAWASGTTSYPQPFPCRIVPRNPGFDENTLSRL
ncbi:cytochrome P450 [Coniophora puteana RWD-64-598 SS2]|uniref:Cytochrome P450 n=1 Tax=Coniophora puteana (strain RWD-64-598) TaxID=741705 RepID=A0A5M3N0C1_CONPW|nr:cytochrome P450 [Coniophora puteana RWD-64-598 SS2]EIW84716.1 cytochrome P450 [Coniophora puteana RWD-64-598 SS2]